MNFFKRLMPKKYANDDEKWSEIRFLRTILFVTTLGVVAITISDGILGGRWYLVYTLTPLALLLLGTTLLLTRGLLWPAKFLVPISIFAVLIYTITVGGGIHDIAMVAFASLLVIASLTLGRSAALIFGVLTSIYVFILGILEINQVIVNEGSFITTTGELILYSILILLTAALLRILIGRLNESNISAQRNEQAQIQINKELRELQARLEQRVDERTAELEESAKQLQKRATQFEIIAQLARTINSIQDPATLTHQITRLVSTSFGFYHVGLFLLDESRQYAVLNAANSEGGQKMLDRKHRLKVGSEGIVGYITSTGNPRIALDTSTDTIFFDNPDLPETRSEMALPLRFGRVIVGALDVQSRDPNAFTEDDVEVLSILADVVSVAIENARLFEESQRVLAEAQTAFSESTLEAWRQITKKRETFGYTLTGASIRPLEKPLKSVEIRKAIETGKVAVASNGKKWKATVLALPIKLREQVIGTMNISLPEDQEWDPDDVDIAQALVERVGVAVENATLLETSHRQAVKQQKIGDITAKISASVNMRNVLQTAVEELGRSIPGSEVVIQFQSNRENILEERD